MARPTANHQRRLDNQAYVLRITENGKPHPVPNHPVAGADGQFILPVPPQTLRPQQAARVGILPARNWNVADEQGYSPPEYDLSGVFPLTPVQIRGRLLDGYQLQRALEAFIRYYLQQNLERGRTQRPMLQLEFHDLYTERSWVVVPQIVPLGERSNQTPLVERYNLRLIAVRPLNSVVENPRQRALYDNPDVVIQSACAECFDS